MQRVRENLIIRCITLISLHVLSVATNVYSIEWKQWLISKEREPPKLHCVQIKGEVRFRTLRRNLRSIPARGKSKAQNPKYWNQGTVIRLSFTSATQGTTQEFIKPGKGTKFCFREIHHNALWIPIQSGSMMCSVHTGQGHRWKGECQGLRMASQNKVRCEWDLEMEHLGGKQDQTGSLDHGSTLCASQLSKWRKRDWSWHSALPLDILCQAMEQQECHHHMLSRCQP